MQTTILRSPEEFGEIALEYDRLHATGGSVSPFSTHDWISAWWAANPTVKNARVTRVADGGVSFILPTFDQWGSYHKIPILRRRMFGSDHGVTTLASQGGPDAADALAGWIRRDLRPWGALQLGPWLEGPVSIRAIADSLADKGTAVHVAEARNPYLPLPGDWETFLSSRSKNFRRSVKRKTRDFDADGGLTIESHTEPDSRTLLDVVAAVTEVSWQGSERVSVVQASGKAFYMNLAERPSVRLHLVVIRHGERPIGYLVGILGEDTYHAYDTAFDPAFAEASPGFLLHVRALQDVIEAGLSELNFGFDQPYKTRFSPEYRRLEVLVAFGSGLLGSVGAQTRRRFAEGDEFEALG